MDFSSLHAGFTLLLAIVAFLLKRELGQFDGKIQEIKLQVDDLEKAVNDHIKTDLKSHGAIETNLENIKTQLTRLETHMDKIIEKLLDK